MPWIKPVKQKEMKQLNDGAAATVFDRLLANEPDTYQAFLPLQKAIKETSLSDELRELVITFVSMKNGCEYCTESHSKVLGGLVDQPNLLEWLESYRESDMKEEWKAVLNYAEKLTAKPVEVTKEDIERLKAGGYDTKEIVEINQTIAYTSYTNQLSIGLGL
ncbi:hypothetical protein EQV77_07705 [Halobacillus fulvus]|nr:hypothetical protein EQV77_07705 [Halobacillus fulvus]